MTFTEAFWTAESVIHKKTRNKATGFCINIPTNPVQRVKIRWSWDDIHKILVIHSVCEYYWIYGRWTRPGTQPKRKVNHPRGAPYRKHRNSRDHRHGQALIRNISTVFLMAASRNGVRIRDLADHYQCSPDVIKRDLNALEAAGLPIYSVPVGKSNRSLYFLAPDYANHLLETTKIPKNPPKYCDLA